MVANLHLKVIGSPRPPPPGLDLAGIDNALGHRVLRLSVLATRAAGFAFDAPEPQRTHLPLTSVLALHVNLIYEKSVLAGDIFAATLYAHPKFDVQRVGLALRAMPGVALTERRQVAGEIKWGRIRDGKRAGIAKIALRNADSVLAMLLIGSSTVWRQWFLDPARARNNRFIAVGQFDRDIRMVKQAVLESPDSVKYERGVAALLFLLGFSPCLTLETDSPDLVVTTPAGKLAVVECTTRIADFASKLGSWSIVVERCQRR